MLDLSAGTASISTTKGLASRVDKFVVAPAARGSAKFEVKKSGTTVLIHASSGALNVSTQGKILTLAEGATLTLDSGNEAAKAVSPSAATPGGYGVRPPTSFFNLEEALADPSDAKLPWCTNVLCKVPPSVSGHHPCRCRRM